MPGSPEVIPAARTAGRGASWVGVGMASLHGSRKLLAGREGGAVGEINPQIVACDARRLAENESSAHCAATVESTAIAPVAAAVVRLASRNFSRRARERRWRALVL